jgi:hypothetical protein
MIHHVWEPSIWKREGGGGKGNLVNFDPLDPSGEALIKHRSEGPKSASGSLFTLIIRRSKVPNPASGSLFHHDNSKVEGFDSRIGIVFSPYRWGVLPWI